MKQKIGIITLSASDNCGSLLQCYALKKLLEPFGSVEVINFTSEKSHQIYDMPKLKFKTKLRMFFNLPKAEKFTRLKKCRRAYQNFRINQLGIKTKELFSEDLHKIKDKYDVILAGSDQIWNVKMCDFEEAFFCGWTKTKKIAYAPSLGGYNITEAENFQKIIDWIKDFKHLSVREEFGKTCLEAVLNKTVTKVLDPTLTINENYWKELINEPIIKGGYIFFYSWAYCDEGTLNVVKSEAERLGLHVIVIDARKWMNKNAADYGFQLSSEEGPISFLNLMYYAKHAYVESFHGMIFAYLFKKNFYLLDTHENFNNLDARLAELVNLLNIKDRILTPYNYKNINLEKHIEYKPNNKLEELRKISLEYIKTSMESL